MFDWRNTMALSVIGLAALIMTSASPRPAAGQDAPDGARITLSVPLEADDSSGLMARSGALFESRGIQMQRAEDDYISVEAQDYWDVFWQGVDEGHTHSELIMDDIRAQATRRSYEDAGASGGQYLERMTNVSYFIRVRNPGEYTLWARMWRPGANHWVYQISMRPAARINGEWSVPVLLDGEPRQWFWQKIGTVDLPTARQYPISIAGFHNGKRIDKIVLHRDPNWTPEGMGPESSPMLLNPQSGRIAFKPFEPQTPVELKRVHLPRFDSRGNIELQVRWSADGPWTGLDADGRLNPPAPGAMPAVQISATPDAGGEFPKMGLPEIVFEAPAADYPTLQGERARYVFNARTGALSGVEVLGIDDGTLMPTGSEREPFRVFVKPDNDSFQGGTWVGAKDGFTMTDSDIGPRRLSFNYRANDYPITVAIEYVLNDRGYVEAAISVKNDYEHDILQVEFPRLANLRAGSDSSDDTLIWPAGTGRKYPNPSTQSELTTEYPRAVMPWCALYDDRAGFYFGAHDPNLVSMELKASPDASRTWMGMQMTKRDRIRAGGGEAAFPFAFGAFAGTWHTAATWYKGWYDTRFPRADWPAWTLETDGWQFANISFQRPGYHYSQMIEQVFRRAIVHGFQHVQVWGSDTANSCPTYFYPPDDAGGPEAFAAVNKWWRDRGGQIGYYVLPQGPSTWVFHDESTQFFGTPWNEMPEWAVPPGKLEGKAWQWLTENARYDRPDRREPQVARERWDREYAQIAQGGRHTNNFPWQYTAMSMYSEEWVDWFVGWVMRYVRDFHNSTMYLDTLHTQAQLPDYNPHLGLHGDGRGGLLRSKMSQRIFEEGRRLDPDWLPVMEMQCDAYQPWMAQQVGSSSMDSEIMKFTHPDHLQFEGQTGAGWGAQRFKRFNSSWMYGNRLDHREYEGWATEIIYMRGWLTRWLNGSRFMDNLGMTVSHPELRGMLHRVNDNGSRGFVAMFWNTARRERHPGNETLAGRDWPDYRVSIDVTHMAQVDNAGTVAGDWIPERAILIDMGHEPREIHFDVVHRRGRPHVEFMLPARQVNGVLFVRNATGPRSALVRWAQNGFRQMDVHILNPGTETVAGEVTVRSDKVEFEAATQRYAAAPGERITVSFPYRDGKPPVWAEPVHIDVTMNGASRTIFAGAYPFADNASFEEPTAMTTTDAVAFDGQRSLVIENSQRLRFRLHADTKYRMTMRLRAAQGQFRPVIEYDPVQNPRYRVAGHTLRFNVQPQIDDRQWTEVSFTFQTPTLYHDGDMLIRAGRNNTLYLDGWEIETLPVDAEVEHKPDTRMEG